MTEVRFTNPFKRRLKKLSKRYRSIQKDINSLLEELEEGNIIGNQITGITQNVFNLSSG